MPSHRLISVFAAIAVFAVMTMFAMPLVSDYLPPGMYARTYKFQNRAAHALDWIIVTAEILAVAGLVVAAVQSKGRIFREDRWLLPIIGVVLVGLAIAAFFAFGWLITGRFP
jgi:hypothetical protein